MKWNTRAMRAIMVKDLRQVAQNRMVWLPMILLPAILNVLMPLVLILLPTLMSPADFQADDLDMGELFRVLPGAMSDLLSGMSLQQQWVYLASNVMFAPLFLIVPLMVSSILAADSFVGEKERKTLEGLLYTPVTDAEMFVAKLLNSFVPACALSVCSFVLYGIVVNVSAYHIMGRLSFPSITWVPLVLWLSPAMSAAALGATVLISSKAKSFMQAQQASGFMVLPVVFLMIGQMAGLFFMSAWITLAVGLVVWIVGLWLIWIGARTFSRGELIARI